METSTTLPVTRKEVDAIDGMMLKQIEELCKMGATDFAEKRRDLRMRVLAILDEHTTEER